MANMMHVPPRQPFDDAHDQDRMAAQALRQTLTEQGRQGHPAMGTLDVIEQAGSDLAAQVQIAAIAFEAAVRIAMGAEHGPALAEDRITIPERLIIRHDSLPWDPPDKRGEPHLHIDWRSAMVAGAAALRAGRLPVPHDLPGAALLRTVLAAAADPEQVTTHLLGDKPRDDTLDPVATGANFLSQAMPDFVDIEVALRDYRERRLAQAAGPA